MAAKEQDNLDGEARLRIQLGETGEVVNGYAYANHNRTTGSISVVIKRSPVERAALVTVELTRTEAAKLARQLRDSLQSADDFYGWLGIEGGK